MKKVPSRKGTSGASFTHLAASSAVFDDDNLVSCAGLVPVMQLAEQTGLRQLLADKVRLNTSKIPSAAANPAPKLATVVAGMCAGITVASFGAAFAAPEATRDCLMCTFVASNLCSPVCSASVMTGTKPAHDTRLTSSNTADEAANPWETCTESVFLTGSVSA